MDADDDAGGVDVDSLGTLSRLNPAMLCSFLRVEESNSGDLIRYSCDACSSLSSPSSSIMDAMESCLGCNTGEINCGTLLLNWKCERVSLSLHSSEQ